MGAPVHTTGPVHPGETDRPTLFRIGRSGVPCAPMPETLAPAGAPVVGAPADLVRRLQAFERSRKGGRPRLSMRDVADGIFYVLALSQNEVRLLQATRHSVREIDLTGVPQSMAEALRTKSLALTDFLAVQALLTKSVSTVKADKT